MRLINLLLFSCLVLIQFPLWYGKGGWFHNETLQGQLKVSQAKSESMRLRNDKLRSEVEDLDTGTEALEERARQELGFIGKDEVFIQILDKPLPGYAQPVAVAPVTPDPSAPAVKEPLNTEAKQETILQVPKD